MRFFSRYWAAENPREMHQRKVTDWCAVSHFFFENAAVTSERYVFILDFFTAGIATKRY